jgi:hypothetical protein
MTESMLVDLHDDVLVSTAAGARMRKGIVVGGWYVWPPDISVPGHGPDELWTVGHLESGLAVPLGEGLTFQDALRLARALDDAFGAIGLDDLAETECGLFWSVLGAALADHYVFPIDRGAAA